MASVSAAQAQCHGVSGGKTVGAPLGTGAGRTGTLRARNKSWVWCLRKAGARTGLGRSHELALLEAELRLITDAHFPVEEGVMTLPGGEKKIEKALEDPLVEHATDAIGRGDG